jgi:hypothetical protein
VTSKTLQSARIRSDGHAVEGNGVIQVFEGWSVENCLLTKAVVILNWRPRARIMSVRSSAALRNCNTAGDNAVPSARGDAVIQTKGLFACDMHNA